VRPLREAGGAELVPLLVEVAREQDRLGATCAELLAVRRALAGALVERLVAVRPSDAALDGVEAAIGRLERAIGSPTESVAAADLAVVGAWVDAAGSDVLAVLVQPVGRLLGSLPELASAIYAEPAVNVALWRAMLAAVRDGSARPEALLALLAERDADTVRRIA
jgi:hypothetical protein